MTCVLYSKPCQVIVLCEKHTESSFRLIEPIELVKGVRPADSLIDLTLSFSWFLKQS